MAGEGAAAGAGQGPGAPQAPGMAGPGPPGPGSDWAGLPEDLLMKVAGKLVAQTEAGWAAWLKEWAPYYWTEKRIQMVMANWRRDGNCLFVFARVCKLWRKAQLKVGGRLYTRVRWDVLLPGSVALAKWALAEGCPREAEDGVTMAHFAAQFGHKELVQYLIQEQGFPLDLRVKLLAAHGGHRELVQWLRTHEVLY